MSEREEYFESSFFVIRYLYFFDILEKFVTIIFSLHKEMGENKMKRNLTEGNVLKVLIMFALPYLLSSFLQTFYGMADLYVVGQFNGADTISAVSIGSQFMHMLTVVFIGLSMGTTVRLGNAIGRKDHGDAKRIVGNTTLLFIVVAIIFTVILLIFTPFVIKFMSTPKEAVEQTSIYLTICFIGIPFIIAYNVISSIFRGVGDSKTPMYFIFIACFTNVALDYLFVGYFSLGTSGAALATILAQALSSIIALIYMIKKPFAFKIQSSDFKLNIKVIQNIMKSGIPIAMQDGLIQVSFLIITIIANSRGLIFATGVGITEKVISFLFLVPSAFLSALSASVAQNIGARKPERANQMLRYGLMITVIYGLTCGVIAQFIPKTMIALFTNDQAVIEAGSLYLMSYAWDCMFAGVHFCFSGYFCGCNKPMLSFIQNIISIIVVRVPGAYLASVFYPDTLYPMGWAAPLGSLLSAIICVGFYFHMKKKKITYC